MQAFSTLVVTDERATAFLASTTGRNRFTTGLALLRESGGDHRGYKDIVSTSPGNATGIRWWVMWCGAMGDLGNSDSNPLPNVPNVATRLSSNNSPLLPLVTIVHVKNSLQEFMEVTNDVPFPEFPTPGTMFEIDPTHALECPLYSRLCFTIEGGEDSVYADHAKYVDKFICLFASDFDPFKDTYHMYECTRGRTVACRKVGSDENIPQHQPLQDAIEEQIAFTSECNHAAVLYNRIQADDLWNEGVVSLDHHN